MVSKRILKKQLGLTLLEVLIALVVLSVGLLGIAGMQATGLKNNHSAYTKTQATVLAMDMADRIRANAISADTYNNFDTATSKISNQTTCQTTNGCSPAQMAEFDMYQWSRPLISENNPILPEGQGKIEKLGDGQFAVTIIWLENGYDDISRAPCDTSTHPNSSIQEIKNNLVCYTLEFSL